MERERDGGKERRAAPRDGADLLRTVADQAEERFRRSQMIFSFDEFLGDVLEHPQRHLRSAAQYARDAIDHFGSEPCTVAGERLHRYAIFTRSTPQSPTALHGQERVQCELVKRIKAFADKGTIDRLLMLHGPNGSAKTTVIECLIRGLEDYSHTDEGALYRFNWIFSDTLDRDNLGFGERKVSGRRDTYAHLEPEEVSARIVCELKDNPLYLVPLHERERLLEEVCGLAGIPLASVPPSVRYGKLCPKCHDIFETLLTAYQGEWERVVRHVQVERFFVSKRYRQGVVSIEPQRNVDASSRTLQIDSRKQLPVLLQNATLHELVGDLVDANRGLVEYSDFFKRPLEVNKYLLTTIEKNTISLASSVAYLDVLMVATANEKNLCIARRDPDFTSFKGRFEFIGVPYLLVPSAEERIYAGYLERLAREKHVAPHTARIAALWAVLTRLRRPSSKEYPGALGSLVVRLTPLEKARLYDAAEPPEGLNDQERRELLASLGRLRNEFDDTEEEFEGLLDSAYEGRRGASPREMTTLLADAAANPEFPCLAPQAVISALRDLVRDVSLHDFLRAPPEGAYRDAPRLIEACEDEAHRLIREDVEDALELASEDAYERLFDDYFVHVRAHNRGEKVRNPQTGDLAPPDEPLMRRVETAVGLKQRPDEYRKDLVTRIAVWSIDHPGSSIDMREVFPDIFRALKREFFEDRRKQIDGLLRAALTVGTDDLRLLEPAQQKAGEQIMARLCEAGYCQRCAKEALTLVLQRRKA